MTHRILVSAGERSGDLHGAAVVRALRRRFPDAVIDAFGGPALAAAGASVLWAMEQYTVMGLTEIIAKIPAHARLLADFKRRFKAGRYDLVILIDYPGFHLRVAEAARAAGVPVLYYIAPQLWAWRPERARRFGRAVDRFAVIFPFEEEFFRDLGLTAEYVGHPLVDRAELPDRDEARRVLGIAPDARVVGLLPGSRPQELARLWPAFRDTGRQLLASGSADVALVAAVPGGDYAGLAAIQSVDRAEMVLAAADAAVAKSGTTTLEAALAGTPMVVAYRVHGFTAWVARRLMRVPWIALPNLIARRSVVAEVVQKECRPDRLVPLVQALLDPTHPETRAQREGLAEVRRLLGGPGAADRVAETAASMLL